MKINSFLKQNIIISSGIFFSRITGFIRDIFFSNILGIGYASDAFFAAFKLPNIFRRVFADGGLIIAFVPIFTKSYRRNKKVGLLLAGQVLSFLFIFISFFVLFLILIMPFFIKLTNPGFIKDLNKLALTVKCADICIFFLILTSISALMAGVLNSIGKFFYHTFSTVLFNLGLIIFVYFFLQLNLNIKPVFILCYGLLFGGFCGMMFNFLGIKLNNVVFTPKYISFNKKVVKIVIGIYHSILSSGVLNVFINMIFASFYNGVMSYIYYVDRLINLPVSIIGYSLGTSTLSAISISSSDNDHNSSNKTHNSAVFISLFLSIPCCVFIFLYSDIILHIIYYYSSFSNYDFYNLNIIVKISSISIPFIILNRIFSSSFFAVGLSKVQFRISIFGIILNILLTLFFMYVNFSIFSMSIAYSMTCFITFFITLFCLKYYKVYNFFIYHNFINLLLIVLAVVFSTVLIKLLFVYGIFLHKNLFICIFHGILFLMFSFLFFFNCSKIKKDAKK